MTVPPCPEVVAELLAKACPSIQYRLRLEVLGQPPSDDEMIRLQESILRDEQVRAVMSWQQPDGWLASDFHGSYGLEAGVRLLCEKGVDPGHPVIAGALDALEAASDRLDRGIGKVGAILDEMKLGGSLMIRAAVFAYAGAEDRPGVGQQIDCALEGLRAVLGVGAIEDIVEMVKGKPVFRPGVVWPSIYHVRLLAFTHGWRTPDNQAMLARSIRRLVELSPLPAISARRNSQIIAPASFCMQDFNPRREALDPAGWMMWFHRMELLARLGVVSAIPELQAQVDELRGLLDTGGGWFTARLTHAYFKTWGAYTGLMLEPDWKSAERRVYDLTFRSLLILARSEAHQRLEYE
jgi:hypothetical protein